MRDDGDQDERPEADSEVQSSRLWRTAALGRLAATEAAKYAGTRAVNLTRTPGNANEALGRRQVDAADIAHGCPPGQLLTGPLVLGTL